MIMLRQYNSIVNECLTALKSCDFQEMEKLQIEVRLYTLKRRLLDVDPLTSKPQYGSSVTDFEDLKEKIDRCRVGSLRDGDVGYKDVITKLDELISGLSASA